MRMLVTGKQMKAIDAYTIHAIGVPSLVLMERAALKVAQAAERLWKKGIQSGQCAAPAIMGPTAWRQPGCFI